MCDLEIRKRLINCFPGSKFIYNDEFIAHAYSNTYFIFRTCSNEEDVKCKLLEWFSRPAAKGIPYSQEWRNKKFRKFMLDGINQFLGTKFSFDDMYIIYQYLGNCCNHEKTIQFVKNNYDMKILH